MVERFEGANANCDCVGDWVEASVHLTHPPPPPTSPPARRTRPAVRAPRPRPHPTLPVRPRPPLALGWVARVLGLGRRLVVLKVRWPL